MNNTRKSDYPTLEAATEAACKRARFLATPYVVVADQPHDGGFTIGEKYVFHPPAVYMNVDSNGKASEGPMAKSLPIGFAGALPIPQTV